MLTWDTYIFGARLFLWAYLMLSFIAGCVPIIYFNREKLRKKYYEIRFPEHLLILNIVYPAGYLRRFYRLIPDLSDKTFLIDHGIYNFNEEAILRKNEWYARHKDGYLIAVCDGKEYNLNLELGIKERWDKWPELWYKFGNPWPIDFYKTSPNILAFNNSDFERFKQSKKLNEIYSALTQDNLMIFVLVILVIVLIVCGVTLGKTMGWIK